jgi:hypothetical protein
MFLMFSILLVAMKPHEIQEKLGLTRIRDRNWYVQPSCATTGDGLYEGLTWLTSNHKLWTHQQWLATCRTHAVTRHTFVVITVHSVGKFVKWSGSVVVPNMITSLLRGWQCIATFVNDTNCSLSSVVKFFWKFTWICSNKLTEENRDGARRESKEIKFED